MPSSGEHGSDTAEQCWSHWHAHHIAGATHRVASLDRIDIVVNHRERV